MTIQFTKYQGTGNDFILIDNRLGVFSASSQTIERLCDRRFGIGADGLILLENCDEADFKMVYFNADGRESSMCGNGGRCLAHFAFELGVGLSSGEFIAIDGRHPYQVDGQMVRLKMKDVASLEALGEAVILDTGSPHYVIFSEDRGNLADLPIVTEARKVRYSDRFRQEGINVNFSVLEKDKIYMRTYERGVEDETLSCGTGTVAVALATAQAHPELKSPLNIEAPGGKLKVHYRKNDLGFSDIWLDGPAVRVFDGGFKPEDFA